LRFCGPRAQEEARSAPPAAIAGKLRCRRSPAQWFVPDSPLEGAGFEPSVPPAAVSSGHLDARDATHAAGWRAWVTSDTTRWRRTVTGSLRKSMVLTQSCGVSTSQIHGSGASIRQPDLPGSSLVAKACRHAREGVGHERDANIRRPDLRGQPSCSQRK
jgi:hypothetical protein